MDNIKLEELLSKIISEDDNDEEICMMVEECKKEDEEKNKSILTTSIAEDAFQGYIAPYPADIYTTPNEIIYHYPDGHEFVIDTRDYANINFATTATAIGYAPTASSGISGPAIDNMAIDPSWVPYYR